MSHCKALVGCNFLVTLLFASTCSLPLQRKNSPEADTSLLELKRLLGSTSSVLVSTTTKILNLLMSVYARIYIMYANKLSKKVSIRCILQ